MEPITLQDLDQPNGVLMEHDRCPPLGRLGWARRRFADPALAAAFLHCARDRAYRALLEFQLNGAMPYEELAPALRRGFLEGGVGGSFRCLLPNARGEAFVDLRITERGVLHAPQPGGRFYAARLLEGAVMGYLARNTGDGVVLRRDVLEAALDLPDMALLGVAVDPLDGKPLLARLPDDLPLWAASPRSDAEVARRECLGWRHVVGPAVGRGFGIHDLRDLRRGSLGTIRDRTVSPTPEEALLEDVHRAD